MTFLFDNVIKRMGNSNSRDRNRSRDNKPNASEKKKIMMVIQTKKKMINQKLYVGTEIGALEVVGMILKMFINN